MGWFLKCFLVTFIERIVHTMIWVKSAENCKLWFTNFLYSWMLIRLNVVVFAIMEGMKCACHMILIFRHLLWNFARLAWTSFYYSNSQIQCQITPNRFNHFVKQKVNIKSLGLVRFFNFICEKYINVFSTKNYFCIKQFCSDFKL